MSQSQEIQKTTIQFDIMFSKYCQSQTILELERWIENIPDLNSEKLKQFMLKTLTDTLNRKLQQQLEAK